MPSTSPGAGSSARSVQSIVTAHSHSTYKHSTHSTHSTHRTHSTHAHNGTLHKHSTAYTLAHSDTRTHAHTHTRTHAHTCASAAEPIQQNTDNLVVLQHHRLVPVRSGGWVGWVGWGGSLAADDRLGGRRLLHSCPHAADIHAAVRARRSATSTSFPIFYFVPFLKHFSAPFHPPRPACGVPYVVPMLDCTRYR